MENICNQNYFYFYAVYKNELLSEKKITAIKKYKIQKISSTE